MRERTLGISWNVIVRHDTSEEPFQIKHNVTEKERHNFFTHYCLQFYSSCAPVESVHWGPRTGPVKHNRDEYILLSLQTYVTDRLHLY